MIKKARSGAVFLQGCLCRENALARVPWTGAASRRPHIEVVGQDLAGEFHFPGFLCLKRLPIQFPH